MIDSIIAWYYTYIHINRNVSCLPSLKDPEAIYFPFPETATSNLSKIASCSYASLSLERKCSWIFNVRTGYVFIYLQVDIKRLVRHPEYWWQATRQYTSINTYLWFHINVPDFDRQKVSRNDVPPISCEFRIGNGCNNFREKSLRFIDILTCEN